MTCWYAKKSLDYLLKTLYTAFWNDLTDAGADSDSDLDSSDVGDAENKEPSGEASDSSDAGQGSEEPADAGDAPEGEEGEEEVVDDLQDGVENEDIDLEEILKALTEEDEEEGFFKCEEKAGYDVENGLESTCRCSEKSGEGDSATIGQE